MTTIGESGTPSTQKTLTIRGTEKRTQPMDWSFPMFGNNGNETMLPSILNGTKGFQPMQNGIGAFQPPSTNNGTAEAFQPPPPPTNGIAAFQPTQNGTTGAAFQFSGGMASDGMNFY
jgi:hypothetical protein